ncbi:MAG: isocitrate/isopropylmalate dehydrogenase family protein [bacterium]|nr:isocitrate/isopropylmalate dehydrogenase family protein [bacterium]
MNIIVLPGDGIGTEITKSTMRVLHTVNRHLDLDLHFDRAAIGFEALEKTGTTVPPEVLEQARRADGIILGPNSSMDYPPPDQGGVNVSAAFRVKLDLYANIRPARSRPGLPNKAPGMDLVIVREVTEGFYPDRNMVAGTGEFMPTPDMALSVRKITAFACERIARRAFELARRRRKKVTAVHKVNTMTLCDGLFLREVRKVAQDFPDCQLEEILIDTMAALLVREPARFDVICATNFYGDILSDLASELTGSLGLGGSINAGDTQCAAQAQHGSAPDIAGQDRANPTSLILSAAMMLQWLGEKRNEPPLTEAANLIQNAVDATLKNPDTRTKDLGGQLGTIAFTNAILTHLEANFN